jgi:hypothetical protein
LWYKSKKEIKIGKNQEKIIQGKSEPLEISGIVRQLILRHPQMQALHTKL